MALASPGVPGSAARAPQVVDASGASEVAYRPRGEPSVERLRGAAKKAAIIFQDECHVDATITHRLPHSHVPLAACATALLLAALLAVAAVAAAAAAPLAPAVLERPPLSAAAALLLAALLAAAVAWPPPLLAAAAALLLTALLAAAAVAAAATALLAPGVLARPRPSAS